METILLILDAAAVMVLVFTSLRNDKLGSDGTPTGPFRFRTGQAKRRGSSDDGSGGLNAATSLSAMRRK